MASGPHTGLRFWHCGFCDWDYSSLVQPYEYLDDRSKDFVHPDDQLSPPNTTCENEETPIKASHPDPTQTVKVPQKQSPEVTNVLYVPSGTEVDFYVQLKPSASDLYFQREITMGLPSIDDFRAPRLTEQNRVGYHSVPLSEPMKIGISISGHADGYGHFSRRWMIQVVDITEIESHEASLSEVAADVLTLYSAGELGKDILKRLRKTVEKSDNDVEAKTTLDDFIEE